ncbi:MAG: glycoside hydrolase family 26 protein [Solirubrobacteraceae bacterium]
MASNTRITLAGLLLAVLALAGLLGVPHADASRAAVAGRDQTLFGMDVPSLDQLDASQSALGARAAVVGTFADWAHSPDFPRSFAAGANARGAVALISWEPWDSWRGGADQPDYALRRIAAGDHDALIDRWAIEIARYGRPVMIRFAPEMNGDWLPWSTGVNGNRRDDYVAAWRHVRQRFRRAGATNAIWVWNPIAAYDGSTPLRTLFPGTGEVDWVALDGYNWGAARNWGWQSYADIFAPTVRALRALAPGRPLMIAEIGCAPDPRKAGWVNDTLQAARADHLNAVVWFDFAKEVDWRLAGDPASARAAHAVLEGGGWRQGGSLAAIERLVRPAG